jgi:ribosomal protein S18 acetylase RimI-like enzyme
MDKEEVSIRLVIPIGEQQKTEFETETTTMVGYIGMLAVSEHFRRRGIGKALVRCILRPMRAMGCASASFGNGNNECDGTATLSRYLWFYSRIVACAILFGLE